MLGEYVSKRIFSAMTIVIVLALVCGTMSGPAQAKFPEKPITLIVPFKAGGSTDTMCRVFAKGLSEQLGQPVVVQNRPGAGGAVGAIYLKNLPADGYSILVGSQAVFTWPPIHDKLDYTWEDFTYLGAITQYQMAMVCNPDKPFKTLAELIEYSKENPGVTYADQGSITKVMFSYVAKKNGLDWRAVPTKGGGGMIPMLLGGQIDFAFSGGVHQRYGDKIRVLASAIDEPLAANPEAPVLSEAYAVVNPALVCVTAPKGLPADVKAYLEMSIEKATKYKPFVNILKDKLKFPQLYKTGDFIRETMPEIVEKLKGMKETTGM